MRFDETSTSLRLQRFSQFSPTRTVLTAASCCSADCSREACPCRLSCLLGPGIPAGAHHPRHPITTSGDEGKTQLEAQRQARVLCMTPSAVWGHRGAPGSTLTPAKLRVRPPPYGPACLAPRLAQRHPTHHCCCGGAFRFFTPGVAFTTRALNFSRFLARPVCTHEGRTAEHRASQRSSANAAISTAPLATTKPGRGATDAETQPTAAAPLPALAAADETHPPRSRLHLLLLLLLLGNLRGLPANLAGTGQRAVHLPCTGRREQRGSRGGGAHARGGQGVSESQETGRMARPGRRGRRPGGARQPGVRRARSRHARLRGATRTHLCRRPGRHGRLERSTANERPTPTLPRATGARAGPQTYSAIKTSLPRHTAQAGRPRKTAAAKPGHARPAEVGSASRERPLPTVSPRMGRARTAPAVARGLTHVCVPVVRSEPVSRRDQLSERRAIVGARRRPFAARRPTQPHSGKRVSPATSAEQEFAPFVLQTPNRAAQDREEGALC